MKTENPYFVILITLSAPDTRGALYIALKVEHFSKKVCFSKKCQKGRFGALFAFWSQGDIRNEKSTRFFIWVQHIMPSKRPSGLLSWLQPKKTLASWDEPRKHEKTHFLSKKWIFQKKVLGEKKWSSKSGWNILTNPIFWAETFFQRPLAYQEARFFWVQPR